MPVGCGGPKRLLVRNPVNAAQAAFEKLVRLRLDPVRDGWLRRPAVGRIVLEAAVMGRIMRRRDHDAIGKTCFPPAVVRQNRVGNGRSRGILVPRRKHDFHAVGRQHLQRAGKSRHGERMRIHAEEQRAVDLLLLPVQANGLTDGQDMPLVESLVERGTAMPRGAKRDPLRRHRRIRRLGIIGRDKSGHVDEHRWLGRLSRKWAHFHRHSLPCRATFRQGSIGLSKPMVMMTSP